MGNRVPLRSKVSVVEVEQDYGTGGGGSKCDPTIPFDFPVSHLQEREDLYLWRGTDREADQSLSPTSTSTGGWKSGRRRGRPHPTPGGRET